MMITQETKYDDITLCGGYLNLQFYFKIWSRKQNMVILHFAGLFELTVLLRNMEQETKCDNITLCGGYLNSQVYIEMWSSKQNVIILHFAGLLELTVLL